VRGKGRGRLTKGCFKAGWWGWRGGGDSQKVGNKCYTSS